MWSLLYVLRLACIKCGSSFFQSFHLIYAKRSHFTEPVIQHLVNANRKPHLLYGSKVIGWNNSELSNVVYAFDSAMCMICNVNLKLLPMSDVIHTGLASLLVNKPICLPDIYASLPVRSFDLHAVT